MKSFVRSFLPLTLLTLCSAKPPADLQARLDAFAQDQPGGVAIAWVDADGPAFFTAGKYSTSDPRPITPDTLFEIGSVSKVFTALLLAESERLGKVSRSDPAAKYLLPATDPAQPALAKITLVSLATHSSGLPRLPANLGPNPDANPYASYDRAALVEGLRAEGPGAPSGQGTAYSNFGVSVLGEALGAAWNTSYTEALQTHVLAPLSLKATSVGLSGEPPPADLAPAHRQGHIVPNWTWNACAAAGGLRSSARDMAAFLTQCIGKIDTQPISGSIDATLQSQRSDDKIGGHIALGWMLTDDPKHPLAWHNGATRGSHSLIAFDRKSGQGIVILVNNDKAADELGFSLLGAKSRRPAIPVVKDATRYIGRYPLTSSFAIDVTESSGALFIQATGQGRLRLREIEADHFKVMGVPAEISFDRDVSGKITALVLHQNGRDQRGPRQDLPPPPKE